MNKIIKVITLLTLITCLTPTSNVAFADCPRVSKDYHYEPDGDCVWEFYNHKTIKNWVDNKDAREKAFLKDHAMIISTLTGVIAGCHAGLVGCYKGFKAGVKVGAGLGVTIDKFYGFASHWLQQSADHDECGVKIKYCYVLGKPFPVDSKPQ